MEDIQFLFSPEKEQSLKFIKENLNVHPLWNFYLLCRLLDKSRNFANLSHDKSSSENCK